MDDILQPHREAVADRCALETTVLLVQDTTTLNYSGLQHCTTGLGPLVGKSKGQDGLLVHAGRALGVFWLRPWACLEELKALTSGEKVESERSLEGFGQAVELGRACPHTRVITVYDRAGDVFSLLRRLAAQPDAAGLLSEPAPPPQRRPLDWLLLSSGEEANGAGRPAHGGALRAALADRGILQGAQARHEATGP